MPRYLHVVNAGVIVLACGTSAWAQAAQTPRPPRPTGRVSFYMTTDMRQPDGMEAATSMEFATAMTFRTPEMNAKGLEYSFDVRHTGYSVEGRPQRVSIYDGYVGARFGAQGQIGVRAGHMWLPNLGTAGALAGALVEYRGGPAGSVNRIFGGAFAGAEPLGFEAGYAPNVWKVGGYVGLSSGYLRRHVLGFANITNNGVTERSMLSVTNYIPVGKAFFAYQALEYDIKGPADGTAKSGLAYFLVNARASAGTRVELQGTYNRGRSINARQLTEDMISGRPLSAQAIEGLRYETAGGRVSFRLTRGLQVSGGYARDRNNRTDIPTGRVTVSATATDLLRSGLDVTVSDARINRPSGPYHSMYVSLGRALARSVYASVDYSSSLAVVRFLRSDGVTIETKPWTRRLSGNVSATINRHFSFVGVVDVTMDQGMRDVRAMTGVTYRIR